MLPVRNSEDEGECGLKVDTRAVAVYCASLPGIEQGTGYSVVRHFVGAPGVGSGQAASTLFCSSSTAAVLCIHGRSLCERDVRYRHCKELGDLDWRQRSWNLAHDVGSCGDARV